MTPAQTFILNDLTASIPGAGQLDIQGKLLTVMREFLEFTNAWYEDIDVVLVAGDTTYTLTPTEVPPGQIVRLLVLYDPQSDAMPDLNWVDRAQLIMPNTLQISTTPVTVTTWVARVGKTVNAQDVDGFPYVPDWIYQRYRQHLIAGVKRDFALEINKPWSSFQMGGYWGKQFLAYKAEARIDVIKSNVLGQVGWRYPTLVRGSQRGM